MFQLGQRLFGLCVGLLLLSSCSDDGFVNKNLATSTPDPLTESVARLALGTDLISIKTGSSVPASITASVLNASNVVVTGATVVFVADGGVLSAGTGVTDESGIASVKLSGGSIDRSNRTITVTASAGGRSAQLQIQVSGSKVTLQTIVTSITTDGLITSTMTATAFDGDNQPIYGVPLTFYAATLDTGMATVTPAATTTDLNGIITAKITGTVSGRVGVTVSGQGATASQIYTVAGASQAFSITSPAKNPVPSLSTGTNMAIIVQAPAPITSVTLVTTLGTWTNSSSTIVVTPVVAGTVSATLNSAVAGIASVQAYDTNSPGTSDTLKIGISAPADAASTISLQSNISVVSPTVGSTSNVATLTATVRSAQNQPVGGAVVAFTMSNQTSSGENLLPVVAVTDTVGRASTTFTSGSLPSGQSGVRLTATVVKAGPVISNFVDIVVGGTPGSVVVGYSTTVAATSNNAGYILPMSVLVADSNGNAISNTVVSLSAWPSNFSTGYWFYLPTPYKRCIPIITGTFPNEDANENLILDAGEDSNYTSSDSWNASLWTYTVSPPVVRNYFFDGIATPPNSAAGNLPSTVTTDVNGVANFELNYLKSSSGFITTRVRASVQAQGTETVGEIRFPLPASVKDTTNVDTCIMPSPSTYGL